MNLGIFKLESQAKSLLAVSALVLGSAAAPSPALGEVIFACKNSTNGMVRIVQEYEACREGEVNLSWNAEGTDPGVTTIAGIVGPDGIASPLTSGFSSTRLSAGRYQLEFPAGTWSWLPVVTASPFGVNGAYGSAIVSSLVGYGDGSTTVVIEITSTTPAPTLFDNAFMFIAAQSLSPLP